MTDPFEEFEFKPLTDGLGFHKKADATKANSKTLDAPTIPLKRGLLSEHDFEEDEIPTARKQKSHSISELIAALPPSLDFLDEAEEKVVKSEKSSRAKELPNFESMPALNADAPNFGAQNLGAQNLTEPNFSKPQIFYPLGHTLGNNEPVAKDFSARTDYTIPGSVPSTLNKPAPPVNGLSGIAQTSGTFDLPKPGTPAAQIPKAPVAPSAPTGTSSRYKSRIEESLARAFPEPTTAVPTKRPEAAATKTKETTTQKVGLQKIAFHFGAVVLDAMTITGVSAIFLVCLLLITKVDLMRILSHSQTDSVTQLHLLLLYMAIMQGYMLTARSFFGGSLGEWVFDLQLGTEEQQQSALYPIKVVWRSILVVGTGFVFLPLVSLLSGRDIAGLLSGTQLYRRN